VANTPLTAFISDVASGTLSSAGQLRTASGGAVDNAKTCLVGTATGFGQLYALGNAGAWLAHAAGAITDAACNPDGNGFLFDVTTLEGQDVAAGTWTPVIRIGTVTGTCTADLYARAFRRTSGGVYNLIGSAMLLSNQSITSTHIQYNFSGSSLPLTSFGVGDKLYIDVWPNILTTTMLAGDALVLSMTADASLGYINTKVITPGYDVTPGARSSGRWQPRAMGGTLVAHYVPRSLGGIVLFNIPPYSLPLDIPRAMGGTIIFPREPKYTPRALGSTLVIPFPLPATAYVGPARTNSLIALKISSNILRARDLMAAVEKAQARSRFLESTALIGRTRTKFLSSIRYGLVEYVPRILGGTLVLTSLAARVKFSEAAVSAGKARSRFLEAAVSVGKTRSRFLSGAVTKMQARSRFLESIKSSAGSRAKYLLSIGSKGTSRAKYAISVLFGRFIWVPRALGGTIPLAQLASRAKYLEAAVEKAQTRSKFLISVAIKQAARSKFLEAIKSLANIRSRFIESIKQLAATRAKFFEAIASKAQSRASFLISIGSKAVARVKNFLSVRFGQTHYVPRVFGGTLTYPPTGPVSWTNFLIKVPGANAIVGLARTASKIAIAQTQGLRSRFLSAARFGWLRLVPRVLGGTIIYPSLTAREKSVTAAVEKAQARTVFSSAIVSIARARTKFLSSVRFGILRLIPRVLGGTIIYPSLTSREKSLTAAVEKAQARAGFLEAVGSKAGARSKFLEAIKNNALARSRFFESLKQIQNARSKFLSRAGMVGAARSTFKSSVKSLAQARSRFIESIGITGRTRLTYVVRVAQALGTRAKFVIQTGIVPFGKITHVAVNALSAIRSLSSASYVPRALGSTLYVTIAKSITGIKQALTQALSSSVVSRPSLTLIGVRSQSLTVIHQGGQMAAPFSSTLSTITVTDVNSALVSNASVCSVIVTWPDDTTVTLVLGAGVTNLGSGQYQAKYNTKMVGVIREVWSITAADGITLVTAQFLVGTEY
jgi:hypothetical protein